MFSEWIDGWVFGILKGFITGCLKMVEEYFEKSTTNVQSVLVETPTEFSGTLIITIKNISNLCILPIAGLLITYIFCLELYRLVTEKNRGGDFDTGQLLFLIIKTSAMILLVTNAFDIALAFSDLGKWITDQVPQSALQLPNSISENILGTLKEDDIGQALLMGVFTAIAAIAAMIMNMIVYLVAWGRIITIVIYVAVAPIPFATLLNHDWVGSIGQNYVKNLMALMLQGFFMIICLVVHGALLEKVSGMIASDGSAFFSLSLFLVSMAILVVMLTRTHSLAKSVMGAN
ncbi:CD0415/CD1112 family protein [Bacillus thuringiensis]|nr:CD0415/CD1112 family protein [Bacillus thuringiensis]